MIERLKMTGFACLLCGAFAAAADPQPTSDDVREVDRRLGEIQSAWSNSCGNAQTLTADLCRYMLAMTNGSERAQCMSNCFDRLLALPLDCHATDIYYVGRRGETTKEWAAFEAKYALGGQTADMLKSAVPDCAFDFGVKLAWRQKAFVRRVGDDYRKIALPKDFEVLMRLFMEVRGDLDIMYRLRNRDAERSAYVHGLEYTWRTRAERLFAGHIRGDFNDASPARRAEIRAQAVDLLGAEPKWMREERILEMQRRHAVRIDVGIDTTDQQRQCADRLRWLGTNQTSVTILQLADFGNTFDDLVRQTTQYCDWYCRYYTDVGRQLAMKTFKRIKNDGPMDGILVERNCATFRFWGRTWLTRTRHGQFVSILWTLNGIKEMQQDVDKLRKEGKIEVADALERGIRAFTAQVDAEDGFARLNYDKFCALADSEKDYDPKGKRIYLELMKDALGRSPKWAEKLLAEER